jgi:serine/threonine protein kinase
MRADTVLQGLNYHGSSSDIWSCGIILFALLTGRLPFDDDDIRALLAKVKIGRFTMPPELPTDAKDLIRRMLEIDPVKRITVRTFSPRPGLVLTLALLDGPNPSSSLDDPQGSSIHSRRTSLYPSRHQADRPSRQLAAGHRSRYPHQPQDSVERRV